MPSWRIIGHQYYVVRWNPIEEAWFKCEMYKRWQDALEDLKRWRKSFPGDKFTVTEERFMQLKED
jgi:hypothetical protein